MRFLLFMLIFIACGKNPHTPQQNELNVSHLAKLSQEEDCVSEKMKKALQYMENIDLDLNNLPWYLPQFVVKWQVCQQSWEETKLPSQEETSCGPEFYDKLSAFYQHLTQLCS